MSERIDPVTREFITDEEPDTEPDPDEASTPSAPENFYQDVYSFFQLSCTRSTSVKPPRAAGQQVTLDCERNGMHLVRRVTCTFMNAPHRVRGRRLGQAVNHASLRVSPRTLEYDVFFALNGKVGIVSRFQIFLREPLHVVVNIHKFRHDNAP
jgi:hypothetical protein